MASVSRKQRVPGDHFFLFGPRGTGKSTWLAETFPDALFLDLLDAEKHRKFAARPERLKELVEGNRDCEVLVIDEVQRVPELLAVVHQVIESGAGPQFILTGSSSRKLKRAGVNLLGGRVILRSMHPFLASELGPKFSLDRALTEGMLPLVWDSKVPAETLAAYISLYIKEEVQAESLVRNLGSFARFIEAIAFSQGSQLNLSEVARECEVNRKTVEGFLSILEDLMLCFRLPIFTKRAQRKLSAHPKFFFFDAGVFRSIRPAGPLDRPEEIEGGVMEGLVAQHLRAWCELAPGNHKLYYWRTKSGLEVDFIVYGENGIWAIEVKRTRNIRSRDVKGLRTFLSDYPEAKACLLYMGESRMKYGEIQCLPVAEYLLSVTPDKVLE